MVCVIFFHFLILKFYVICTHTHDTDRRGQLINECVVENDFVLVNQGEKPTFLRRNYGSMLDLTIVTQNMRSSVAHWEVMDEESLSDHNYVFFDTINIQRIRDKDKLQLTLEDLNYDDFTNSARDFSNNLTDVCDRIEISNL